MFRIRNKISNIRFDDKRYLRDTERAINKVVKEAVREWLIAVLNAVQGAPHTDGDSFPIQTGEAKGSLLPVAAILNQSQIPIRVPITPAEGQENRIAIGRQKGHVKLGKTGARMIYNFSFDSGVLHFFINEMFPMNYTHGSETPWDTRHAGQQAFEEHITNNMFKRLPKISSYILTSNISGQTQFVAPGSI